MCPPPGRARVKKLTFEKIVRPLLKIGSIDPMAIGGGTISSKGGHQESDLT